MRHAYRAMIASLLLCMLASCGKKDATQAPKDGPKDAPKVAAKAAPIPAKIVGWRGDGTGLYPDARPVTEWSDEKNIVWRTKVGDAMSTPIIVGDKIFITSEQEEIVCVNKKDGKILWQKTSGFGDLEPKAEEKRFPTACGYSTPTPVSDGRHIWVSHGTGIVACYDLDGARKWIRHLDLEPATADGRSASPVLDDGKLVVSISYLQALDPATGKTVWENQEAEVAYGTPIPAKIGDVDVLITAPGSCVRMSDGKVISEYMGSADYGSPVVLGDVVYFLSATVTAAKLPAASSDKFKVEEIWEADLEGEFYASPVIYKGLMYCLANEGVFTVLDAKDGEEVYQKMLQIPSAAGLPGMDTANIYPSLAVAGGKLFIGNDVGTGLVLEPGREYKEISKHELDEGSAGCPVFDGDRIYLRGGATLFCIGSK